MCHLLKKFFGCLLVALPLFAFAATTKTDKNNLSYFFVQSAASAKITTIDHDKGLYTLTIHNTPPRVTYFTDRPNRIIGLMSMKAFINLWKEPLKDSFGKDAPNVSIAGIKHYHLIEQKDVKLSMILSNPRYDEKNNSMTYDATLIGDKNSIKDKTETLHHVVLFFDIFSPGSCCG